MVEIEFLEVHGPSYLATYEEFRLLPADYVALVPEVEIYRNTIAEEALIFFRPGRYSPAKIRTLEGLHLCVDYRLNEVMISGSAIEYRIS